jgi:hypothetical protein
VGDSLALAREAMKVDAEVIVLAGVHFMAETAKLLNPAKRVLIPDLHAGCSLAASITAADVRLLRQRWPGVPVVTYVNTSAAVKAESDICCTSGNARKIIESLGVERVIMLPDEYLAQNIAAQTGVKIITWAGRCEVHERFTAAEIRKAVADVKAFAAAGFDLKRAARAIGVLPDLEPRARARLAGYLEFVSEVTREATSDEDARQRCRQRASHCSSAYRRHLHRRVRPIRPGPARQRLGGRRSGAGAPLRRNRPERDRHQHARHALRRDRERL